MVTPQEPTAEFVLDAFAQQLQDLDDLIYGVALLFEGISLLYAEQPAVMETYRKQFRNIIHKGQGDLQQGAKLLAEAKQDPDSIHALRGFSFSAFEGYPNADDLKKRACVLVDAYKSLYPDRPRSQEFTRDEALRLVDAAAEAFTRPD